MAKSSPKLNSRDLMKKSSKDIVADVKELKTELAALRVAQVTGGTASKLGKIRVARKNIARALTAITAKKRNVFRKEILKENLKLTSIPKQLRTKKTRAMRRELTAAQKAKQTKKAAHKSKNLKVRQFAIQA